MNATSLWAWRLTVLLHVAGVVVWMGAVAYNVLILRPALRASGIARKEFYAVHRAIKARIRRVVGVAVATVAATGVALAARRGLLIGGSGWQAGLVHLKLGIGLGLLLTFGFALRLLERIPDPKRRGRAFVAVHWCVLLAGSIAAALGVLLSR